MGNGPSTPTASGGIKSESNIQSPSLSYQALRKRGEIRVIELQPGQPQDPISCTIRHVLLDDHPYYMALSYFWGNQKNRRIITCNGQSISITENLESALNHFRHFTNSVVLWADAVCIDQDNPDERGSQVQMMRQIYKQAAGALVWLGLASHDSDLAMDFMDSLNEFMQGPFWQNRNVTYNTLTLTTKYPYGSPHWAALAHLWDRPWFSRVWIIQEVAVAHDVIVFCGLKLIKWEAINRVVEELKRLNFMVPLTSLRSPRLDHLVELTTVRKTLQEGCSYTLFFLLAMCWKSEATDTRDKVYALIGLSNDAKKLGIVPNYHKENTEADVLKHTAKTLLLRESDSSRPNTLDVLSFAGIGQRRDMNFPSWVPQWTKEVGAPLGLLQSTTGYHASGTYRSELEFWAGFLSVKGVRFDSINHLISPVNHADGDNMVRAQKTKHWEQTCWSSSQKCQPYPTGEPLSEVYWRTLVANVDDKLKRAAPEFGHALGNWRQSLGLIDNQNEVDNMDELISQTGAFSKALTLGGSSRCFGTTAEGYMGLFPSAAQVGDLVCVLFGGVVPFLLREHVGYFELVGECYVHGVMEGQAVEGQKVDIRTFILK